MENKILEIYQSLGTVLIFKFGEEQFYAATTYALSKDIGEYDWLNAVIRNNGYAVGVLDNKGREIFIYADVIRAKVDPVFASQLIKEIDDGK